MNWTILRILIWICGNLGILRNLGILLVGNSGTLGSVVEEVVIGVDDFLVAMEKVDVIRVVGGAGLRRVNRYVTSSVTGCVSGVSRVTRTRGETWT